MTRSQGLIWAPSRGVASTSGRERRPGSSSGRSASSGGVVIGTGERGPVVVRAGMWWPASWPRRAAAAGPPRGHTPPEQAQQTTTRRGRGKPRRRLALPPWVPVWGVLPGGTRASPLGLARVPWCLVRGDVRVRRTSCACRMSRCAPAAASIRRQEGCRPTNSQPLARAGSASGGIGIGGL